MSKIEWTEQTWNPVIGCSKLSAGCKNCYAERMACRLANMAIADIAKNGGVRKETATEKYIEVVECNSEGIADGWNRKTVLVKQALDKPLRRKKPSMYFVCSMGDLFHSSVKEDWIDLVFDVVSQCPQHTFQVLTKRPERMDAYIRGRVKDGKPLLPNLWCGTSVESQAVADARIPYLLRTPAALRFVSVEPMLGPVDLSKYLTCQGCGTRIRKNLRPNAIDCCPDGTNMVDLIICGCESGPGRRPMSLLWPRALLSQCRMAGVPFFMKQMEAVRETGWVFVSRNFDDFPYSLRVREWPEGKGKRETGVEPQNTRNNAED